MPRNFFRRIEVMFPVEDPRLKTRIVDEILDTLLLDNVKARRLEPDGSYQRVAPGEGELPVRSQVVFQSRARGQARESGEHPLQFVPVVGREAAGPLPAPRPRRARRVRVATRERPPRPSGESSG
jgi:polyphosphate kinase